MTTKEYQRKYRLTHKQGVKVKKTPEIEISLGKTKLRNSKSLKVITCKTEKKGCWVYLHIPPENAVIFKDRQEINVRIYR